MATLISSLQKSISDLITKIPEDITSNAGLVSMNLTNCLNYYLRQTISHSSSISKIEKQIAIPNWQNVTIEDSVIYSTFDDQEVTYLNVSNPNIYNGIWLVLDNKLGALPEELPFRTRRYVLKLPSVYNANFSWPTIVYKLDFLDQYNLDNNGSYTQISDSTTTGDKCIIPLGLISGNAPILGQGSGYIIQEITVYDYGNGVIKGDGTTKFFVELSQD